MHHAQRWGCLKKKQAPPKVVTNLQPSESLAAAHRAMSMALEMGNNLRAPSQISTGISRLFVCVLLVIALSCKMETDSSFGLLTFFTCYICQD